MPIFAFLCLLFVSLIRHKLDWFNPQWYHGSIVGCCVVGILIYEKTRSKLLGLASFWALASSAYLCFNHYGRYGANTYVVKSALQKYGGQSLAATFFILVLVAFVYHKRLWVPVNRAIAGLSFLDIVYVLFQWAFVGDFTKAGGFFANPSMNGMFIAFTAPIVLTEIQRWDRFFLSHIIYFSLAILSLIASKSTIPMGVFAVALGALFGWRTLPVAGILTLIGYLTQKSFFSFSGRLDKWALYLDYFSRCTWENIFTGFGQGSFFVIGPEIQILNKDTWGGYMLWAHNDWLQLLLEQGVIGFTLGASVFMWALWFSFKRDSYLFASLLAFGVGAGVNYPLRWPVFAFTGTLLVAQAFDLGMPKKLVD